MLAEIESIARTAGEAIMEVFRAAVATGTLDTKDKADGSPLTQADSRAHQIIAEALAQRWPDIPVLSEEGKEIPSGVRSEWRRLWVVDPLDGTKEFIKGLDEFTVNIALVEDGHPTLGVVYAPAKDLMYSASAETGARASEGGASPRSIHVSVPGADDGLTVVTSRSHMSVETEDYLKPLRVAELLPSGSSLKLCAVAEGKAHLYPRLAPTMEWDIAAGQAVVEAAGGEVVDLEGRPLIYNKESLLNPSFVARAKHDPARLRRTGL